MHHKRDGLGFRVFHPRNGMWRGASDFDVDKITLGELLKFEADKYRAMLWFMIAKFAGENCGCPDKT